MRLIDVEEKRLDQSLFGDAEWEMVETTEKRPRRPQRRKAKLDPESKSALFLFLRDLDMAREKGWAPGRADVLHKARTGHWPTDGMRALSPHKTTFERVDGKFKRVWAEPLAESMVS